MRGRAGPISGRAAAVLAIACPAAPGDCAAGGLAGPLLGEVGAFVVSGKDGVWSRDEPVSGTPGPVTAMSCPATASCPGGGSGYLAGSGYPVPPYGTAFLVGERDGRWGPARPVPGLGGPHQRQVGGGLYLVRPAARSRRRVHQRGAVSDVIWVIGPVSTCPARASEYPYNWARTGLPARRQRSGMCPLGL